VYSPEKKEEMMKQYWENIAKRSGVSYTEEQQKIYANLGGTPNLDMQYTVFGEVIEGLDVVDKIAAVQTHQADRPVEDIIMTVKVLKQ
jgi:cyclophilin family peptidyl-prolyl cis-trans isomerase